MNTAKHKKNNDSLKTCGCFIMTWKYATVTTAVFASFGDIDITRQNELFFNFYLLWRTSITALQQMSTTLSRTLKHFLCPEILYKSVYCLIRYFLVWIRTAKCFTSSSRRFREWAHVLFVNRWCSNLHSFCATGVSGGLATRVTLTRVSWRRLGESVTRGWTWFWFHFCAVIRDYCLVSLKRYAL
jgi:hypothetical protein